MSISRTHRFNHAAFAAVLLTAVGCSTNAPTTPVIEKPKGWMRGTIIGALSTPVQGVTITTEPATDTVVTDNNGAFMLDKIPAGVYTLHATKNDSSTFAYYTVIANDTTEAKMRLALWKMSWRDEFNGDTIDLDKWYVYDNVSGLPEQLQYLAPDDIILDSGMLHIRSQKRERAGLPYTSGEVNSYYQQKYGRFEVRARLPRGRGVWPAIWLWAGHEVKQEIDIMEMLGHEPNTIHMTYHFDNGSGVPGHNSMIHVGPDYSQDFHVFALEWYPDQIKWFIDGTERHSAPTVGEQAPLGVWLDTYVGGGWPGAPDSTTVFPQFHDIDYVRVYEAAP